MEPDRTFALALTIKSLREQRLHRADRGAPADEQRDQRAFRISTSVIVMVLPYRGRTPLTIFREAGELF
jgi:hypothetical protein